MLTTRADDLLYVALKKVRVLRGNAPYEFRFYHRAVSQAGAIFVKQIDQHHRNLLQICEGGAPVEPRSLREFLQLTMVCLN